MGAASAAACACVLWALVLVLVPRPLAREAGWAPGWKGLGAGAAALAAVGFVAVLLGAGPLIARIELGLLGETALALAVIDLRLLLIPDVYVAAFALAGLAGPLARGWPGALAGALVAGALLGGVRALAGRRLGREAMGLGDVKLAAALGLLLGPLGVLWAVGIAASLGAVAGLLMRRGAEPPRVPLGAFMAPVALAVLWVERAA